jgi:2-keto-4-pentenoate hydratase
MSSTALHQAAADQLWDLWHGRRHIAALPPDLRPATRAEGYAIQALVERRSARPRFGWKIAATSLAGQQHIQVDGPLAGRLLAEQVRSSGAVLSLAGNQMRVVEGEFAFRMARDLAPRAAAYTRDEVVAAIGALHPAIEVPDSRFQPFEQAGTAQLIADNACTDYFVLGEAAPDAWRRLDLVTHAVTAQIAGGASFTGSGANVLGDPLLALTWIANELSTIGVTLKQGEVVTTGTCFKPFAVAPGDAVTVDFGAIGRVAVSFSA